MIVAEFSEANMTIELAASDINHILVNSLQSSTKKEIASSLTGTVLAQINMPILLARLPACFFSTTEHISLNKVLLIKNHAYTRTFVFVSHW